MIAMALFLSVHLAASLLGATMPEHCLAVLEGGEVVEVDGGPARDGGVPTAEADHYWCWSAADPPHRRDRLELAAAAAAAEKRPSEAVDLRIAPVADGPCAGFHVIAAPVAMWQEIPESLLPRVAVADSCTIELSRGQGESWRLRAVEKGSGSWWVDLAREESRAVLHAVLAEPSRFQTVDPEGQSLMRARLQFHSRNRHGQPRNLVRFAEADGKIEILALPSANRVTAVFAAPGFVSQSFEALPASLPRRVVLQRSAALRGRFVDADENPIRGVEVEAEAWIDAAASLLTRRKATSTPDGAWELDGLPLGEVVLVATSQRFATFRRHIELATVDTDLGTTVLHNGTTLALLVLDAEGAPVAGASVTTTGMPLAIANEAGRAEISGLPPEQAIQITVDADGFLPYELKATPGSDQPVVVTLRAAFEIAGRFVTALGDPVVEGRVEIVEGRTTHFERLDPDGSFRLELPPEVPIEAHFMSPTTRRLTLQIDPGDLGEVRDLGELRAPPGRIVKGRVLNEAEASPVAGARVWMPRPSADKMELYAWYHGDVLETTTDAEGNFTLGGLNALATEIQVVAQGFARTRFRVPPGGEEDVAELGDLSLVRGVEVEVEVEAEVSPAAVARLDLTGRWLEPDMLTAPVHEGIALLERVPPGRVTLTVVDGRRLVCEEEVEITGPDTVTVRCREQPMAVSGVVKVAGLPTGPGRLLWHPEAPPTVSLIVHRASPLGLARSRAFGGGRPQVDADVGADGYFSTNALRAGRWEVVWQPDSGGSSRPLAVELPRQEQVEVPLAFPGHVIRGRVVDLDGEPVAAARVRELGSGSFDRSAQDGTFRFAGISEGTYFLRADAGGKESATVQLELEAGSEIAPVELVLGKRDLEETLQILAVDEDEQPLARAFIFLDAGQGGLRILTTDAAGRVAGRLDPPFPGRVRLAGWANGRWYLGPYIPYSEAVQEPLVLIWSMGGTLAVRSVERSTSVRIISESGWDLSALMARIGQASVAAPGVPLAIEGLPPGPYQLVADDRQWFRQVAAGHDVEIELGQETP